MSVRVEAVHKRKFNDLQGKRMTSKTTKAQETGPRGGEWNPRTREHDDRELDEYMKTSPTAAWALTHGMFVTATSTPRAYVAAALEYHLRNGLAEQISCSTLVLGAEDDIFFAGQPEELYEHLSCPKTLMRFSAAEGAGAHCHVGVQRLAFGRIYDWLDDTLER
jgi:hypothetical protein